MHRELVSYLGLKLIKKYERYYIRFIDGQYEKYSCDLLITEKDAMEILINHAQIQPVRDRYRQTSTWTKDYFINSGLHDYLLNECDMNEEQIVVTISKFNQHEDIKREFYDTIVNREFPKSDVIEVRGYNAKVINEMTHLSLLGVYNFLIYLREDSKNALIDLKNSFIK